MCCFSGQVRAVSGTRIFARSLSTRQLLVYAMRVAADADVAMVLPLPVPPSSPDDAVRFVDLSAHPGFFDDLRLLFPMPQARAALAPASFGAPRGAPLVVHRVGAFEASFVPRVADFDRLDARFRLAPTVWEALPRYADWGFAVFQLHAAPPPASGVFDAIRSVFSPPAAPATDYHPMALELPRRDPSRLFFPTVHVHDGEVHPTARFDHELYCQRDVDETPEGWVSSGLSVGAAAPRPGYVHLDPSRPVFRRALGGELANDDVWV